MKTVALALRYLLSRPLAALLNLLLLTLGLASITFVLLAGEQIERSFQRDLAGIDLVVGAKGSPLQLILAGVFQIDVPPGNVRLADVQQLAQQPQVARMIPLSLGDSFRGYRIVGTTTEYLTHFRLATAAGRAWKKSMEVVIGTHVAQDTGMKTGATFIGSHGLTEGGHGHDEHPYRVTGVLAPCGCVADRLILTASESVWELHEHGHAVTDGERQDGNAQREVTMALVKYKSPLAAASFPRYVNTTTNMQAASPALEVSRLLRMLGTGSDMLRGFGIVLLLTAALSVFIALWNAVRERRADLAMLRMLGARPLKVAALVVCEAWWLALLGSVLGLGLGHALAELAGMLLAAQRSIPMTGALWLPAELWIAAAALAIATVAALIPAASAYRVDVAELLNTR